MTNRGRYLLLSKVNTCFGELIPKASEFIFFGMNLLVLDEATANLGSRMEQDVAKMLRILHGACTVITVTHRSEILKHSDVVLDLEKLPSWRAV